MEKVPGAAWGGVCRELALCRIPYQHARFRGVVRPRSLPEPRLRADRLPAGAHRDARPIQFHELACRLRAGGTSAAPHPLVKRPSQALPKTLANLRKNPFLYSLT